MRMLAGGLCLVMLFLAGCALHRPLVEPEVLAPELLLTRYRNNHRALRDLQGWGLITFRTPEYNAVYGLELVYLEPHRLKAVLKGTLGIVAGKLILNGDQFQIASGSAVYRGDDLNESPLRDEFGFLISSSDLWESLLPLSGSGPSDSAVYEGVDEQSGAYVFYDRSGGKKYEYRLDQDLPVIRLQRWFNADGKLLGEKTAGKIKRIGGLWLPVKWTLRIFRGDDIYSLDVSLSTAKVNRGISEDLFNFSDP